MRRQFSLLAGVPPHQRTHHYVGDLPGKDHAWDRVELPPPAVVVIEDDEAGQVFLYRLGRHAEDCGDTWHLSIAEAIEQAEYEYGDVLGPWIPIPSAVEDARAFAVASITSDRLQ